METFNFGDHVFEEVFRHDESYVVKLSICFPFLIYGILMGQKSVIITIKNEVGVPPQLLSFNYKRFVGKHVPSSRDDIPDVEKDVVTIDR